MMCSTPTANFKVYWTWGAAELAATHNQTESSAAETEMPKAPRAVANLLSDTVTRPSAAMRQVIAAAEVGDDVFGADPSVKRLEKVAAERLGKPAALYVPSGTMSNLIAIGAHCRRGDEVICGDKAHIFLYEGGGANAYMGVSLHTVPNRPDGMLDIQDIHSAVRDDDPHYPRTRLVAIENTHNTCGGRVLPLSYIRDVEQFCHERDLRLHVDGARLANASVACGIPMDELVRGADSVSLCLSKGLGAPVGSILAGSEAFIHHATRLRKSLGGGMRQAGIVASAGLYALENQFDRLVEDHRNARALAHGISRIPGVEIDPDAVDTNIVFFTLTPDAKLDAPTLVRKLESDNGVLVGAYAEGNRVRAVTNLHISGQDVEYIVSSVRVLLS
ncbi:putative low-specificity L-threonine aldolase 1 [Phytophthora pseudosyringae]|uniref:Putative low-specificity L-threonine aldolase 1 n=1 Tax=Phytophthora pseudosyringae TaxID=221518 RepID=A0A8T1W6I9_9STRA|nr:putative low-specificity L-threonine aldolase 1 [Phytophthora pseudosyringae]